MNLLFFLLAHDPFRVGEQKGLKVVALEGGGRQSMWWLRPPSINCYVSCRLVQARPLVDINPRNRSFVCYATLSFNSADCALPPLLVRCNALAGGPSRLSPDGRERFNTVTGRFPSEVYSSPMSGRLPKKTTRKLRLTFDKGTAEGQKYTLFFSSKIQQ